jgi:hypothetical protein
MSEEQLRVWVIETDTDTGEAVSVTPFDNFGERRSKTRLQFVAARHALDAMNEAIQKKEQSGGN